VVEGCLRLFEDCIDSCDDLFGEVFEFRLLARLLSGGVAAVRTEVKVDHLLVVILFPRLIVRPLSVLLVVVHLRLEDVLEVVKFANEPPCEFPRKLDKGWVHL